MAQKKRKKRKYLLYGVMGCIILLLVGFRPYIFQSSVHLTGKDSRIKLRIHEFRILILYIHELEGNYDNVTCKHEEMKTLCKEIDKNYGEIDGKEPMIARDAPNNSQMVCIYSPLNGKPSFIEQKGFWYNLWYDFWYRNRRYWYCADSKGNAGYTSVDPGSLGYCVEGESVVCPPLWENTRLSI